MTVSSTQRKLTVSFLSGVPLSQSLVCLFVCMFSWVSVGLAAMPVHVTPIHSDSRTAVKPALAIAPIKVEYRVSRIHGLLQFALALMDDPHAAGGLKEAWVQSRFQSDEVKKAIADLVSIQQALGNGIDFNSSVASRPLGTSIDSILVTQSLFARDLADFGVRTLELLPMNDQRVLLASLKTLEPVYNTLIWKTGYKDLHTMERALERLALKAKLNEMFAKSVKFYRGNWPSDVPFVIGLYPIPFIKGSKNSTTSTSYTSVEIHGVMTGVKESNIESDFGVVFHELSHSIYKSQSQETMRDLANWFSESKSPYARMAYMYLNEGLATAIGNGWAYQAARGEMDKTDWYNNKIIDAYGKALYPMVYDYLETGRSIDREFVVRAIQTFAEKSPDAVERFDAQLNRVFVLHNGSALKNTDLREIRNSFSISSYSGSAPLLAQETISDLNASPNSVVIVLGPKDQSDFEKFSSQIPFIGSRAKDIRKMSKRSFFASTAVDSRLLLVIKANNADDLRAALAAIKKREKLSPGQVVYDY